ncbi:MAG: 2-oxoacid:acceptor oxidoreductase subunit alpha [Planctomycetota bacterium]|jgi:2-oxoglutarate ferredoxin oxidoreductase subunit alpha
MSRKDVTVIVAGEGGEGVISAGEILTQTAADAGLDVFTFRTYPAEIKGGLAMMQVRLGTDRLTSMGHGCDVLMAFNQEAIDEYADGVVSGGVMLYDPKHGQPSPDYKYAAIPLPLHDTAVREAGGKIAKNVVALASLVHSLGIPHEVARKLVTDKFARKGEDVLAKNLKAFDVGLKLLNGSGKLAQLKLAAADDELKQSDRMIVSGNQAVCLGAIAAGCRFMAGYPITPATSILEFMMQYLYSLGGVAIQYEDEIASLAGCLGSSWAGTKSMTATSGPGLCLMSELIGMASMSEIPVVIVDVQRSGPGTGMPTKTEQSDLSYAIHSSTGEAPRIVIAPTTVEDCFYQTVNAFNLAERFQMPVLLLTDQSMAYRTRTMDVPQLEELEIANRAAPVPATGKRYKRFEDTVTGVSPMAIPGAPSTLFVQSGLEHDEFGEANYTPENRMKMMRKRFRKLDTLERELNTKGNGILDEGHGAELGIIGWGSTEGPIRDAIERARAEGIKVAHMQPKVLMPLPRRQVEGFLGPLKKVLVLEENFTGQLAGHIRANVNFGDTEIVEVKQCSGLPWTSDGVYSEITIRARNSGKGESSCRETA